MSDGVEERAKKSRSHTAFLLFIQFDPLKEGPLMLCSEIDVYPRREDESEEKGRVERERRL